MSSYMHSDREVSMDMEQFLRSLYQRQVQQVKNKKLKPLPYEYHEFKDWAYSNRYMRYFLNWEFTESLDDKPVVDLKVPRLGYKLSNLAMNTMAVCNRVKAIVAGSRTFDINKNKDHLTLFINTLDKLLKQYDRPIIVSGRAKGPDTYGEKYAIDRHHELDVFPAKWRRPDGTTDRGAGYKRNAEMANYGDILIAFWDGVSRGTKHMIDIARKQGLFVHIVYFEERRIDSGTTVIHCKQHEHGDNYTYIGRPSKWENQHEMQNKSKKERKL